MTIKRDFKRRVRLRQARTGESYVTARRHVLAGRPAGLATRDAEPDAAAPPSRDAPRAVPSSAAPARAFEVGDALRVIDGPFAAHSGTVEQVVADQRELVVALAVHGRTVSVALGVTQVEAAASQRGGGGDGGDRGGGGASGRGGGGDDRKPSSGISVVELVDVTEEARRVGLVCRVLMFPPLIDRIAPARVLRRLRDVLIATAGDRATARLSRLALTGQVPPPRQRAEVISIEHLRQFLQRARAGLSGTLDDGATLAFHIADGEELVPVMCALSARDTSIELSLIDGPLPERWATLSSVLTRAVDAGEALRRREIVEALTGDFSGQLWPIIPSRLPGPRLLVVHAGKRYPMTREPFVIGHNAEVCDLVLDDGAVSAEHAAVIVRNGGYYLKDLGSTEGVVHKGMRIDNKRIHEGDVFVIAGHELRFTFLDG